MRNPRARRSRRSRPFVGVLLVGGIALCAGCGPESIALDKPDGASGKQAKEAAARKDSAADKRAEVVSQYRRFVRVTSNLTDYPSHERPGQIERVATDPILPLIMTNLARMDVAGEVLYGEPVTRKPRVELNGKVAIVRDCQDTSDSGRKKASTGKVLSKGVSRAAVVVTFKLGDDGVWRASAVDYPAGTSC